MSWEICDELLGETWNCDLENDEELAVQCMHELIEELIDAIQR